MREKITVKRPRLGNVPGTVVRLSSVDGQDGGAGEGEVASLLVIK